MAHNPVFNVKTLQKLAAESAAADDRAMTINGSINKTGFLLVLMSITSILSWNIAEAGLGMVLLIGSIIANLVLCIVLSMNRQWAPTLAPIYALVEGLAIGAISALFERTRPGIVSNALFLTFSCVGVMLGLYHFRIIRVTERFKTVVIAATLAIALTYVIDIVMTVFGQNIPMIHESGIYGIGFSLVVIGVASMNLLLDFDMVEKAAAQKAPKYMEWYAGFAILVTIVWLYVEILRLLGKMQKR
jgi:uncharacterized YccA/Bax inhibitor family protein